MLHTLPPLWSRLLAPRERPHAAQACGFFLARSALAAGTWLSGDIGRFFGSSPSLSRSRFESEPEHQRVLTRREGVDQPFIFRAVDNRECHWVGELKPEFAQSVAQVIAEGMSRIPLTQLELVQTVTTLRCAAALTAILTS